MGEIDGFLLLEVTGAEFPEDAHQANVSNRNLSYVVEVGPRTI